VCPHEQISGKRKLKNLNSSMTPSQQRQPCVCLFSLTLFCLRANNFCHASHFRQREFTFCVVRYIKPAAAAAFVCAEKCFDKSWCNNFAIFFYFPSRRRHHHQHQHRESNIDNRQRFFARCCSVFISDEKESQ
jgi:hypothetical protein